MKGYVRKRGNKWSYTVDIGKDQTGKRKQKTKSGFDTKKEATKSMNELIYELNKGVWIEPKNIKLKEFSTDWIEKHRHHLRDTTLEQYDSKIKKWIIPLIGSMKVQDIKPIHAQNFSKKLLEHLKPDTAHKVFSIVKMIMNYAVDIELINKNPFNKVQIKTKKKKVTTWTFDELNNFLNVVQQHDLFYYRVFATAAFTGLRKGEVLGLKQSNVDLKNNKMIITQSIAETKEKGAFISELKTPSSYRQIAIDPFVTSILNEQIEKNNEMRTKFGEEYKDYDLIFCHLDGLMRRPTSLNRPFRKFIELANVPYIRFHDMRHTHATLLLELGVNPKSVADRLGHSNVKTTLDVYSHPSIDIQSDAAILFSNTARKS